MPTPDPAPTRRWRGSRLVLAVMLGSAVVTGAIALGIYAILMRSLDRRLDATVAEADRLDSGWQLADVFARRLDPPDGEDSADQAIAAIKRLPEGWPNDDMKALLEQIDALGSTTELRPEVASDLRAELDRLAPAVAVARALADMGPGHFGVVPARDPFATILKDQARSRDLAIMLRLDSLARAHEGDIDGALESARAVLGNARAIGDEPFAITQLIRLVGGGVALACAERALGQGEATDEALAVLQEQLAAEASDHRSFVNGLRGERAILFDFFRKCEAGELSLDGVAASRSDEDNRPGWVNPYHRAVYRYHRAVSLDFMNRVVEAARRPLPEQPVLWAQLDAEIKRAHRKTNGDALGLLHDSAYLLIPDFNGYWRANHRIRSRINAAVVLLACERHRLAHGDWPDDAEQLAPYLPGGAMTLDPYNGEPIRITRSDDGISAYGVGADLIDDGGWFDDPSKDEPGTDLGLRLWDVDLRRQPPVSEDDDEGEVAKDLGVD